MNEYVVSKTGAPDWTKVEKQPLTECAWSPNAAPAATMQALYVENDALYIRLESAAAPARAENTQPDSAVWEDSCLESFLCFAGEEYINLEANANGALRASIGLERHGRRFLKDMDISMPKTAPKLTEDSWEMVFTIPLKTVKALFGVDLKPGSRFKGNFYSCGDKTPAPHYASWSPIETPKPDFHRPEYFGTLIVGN